MSSIWGQLTATGSLHLAGWPLAKSDHFTSFTLRQFMSLRSINSFLYSPRFTPLCRFYNCSGKPKEESLYKAKVHGSSRRGVVPNSQGKFPWLWGEAVVGNTRKLLCKLCVFWVIPVLWSLRTKEGITWWRPSCWITTQLEESFLELALGAAVTSSAPPFGTWSYCLTGTLLIVRWVDFLMGYERCFHCPSYRDGVFLRSCG